MRLKYACIGLCIGIAALIFIEVTGLDQKGSEQGGSVTTAGQQVWVDDGDASGAARQVKTKNPDEVANLWAKGVKERDAKLQYFVMDNNLQDKYYHTFEALNWVTGTSSPWITGYTISLKYAGGIRNVYTVEFVSTDSTGAVYKNTNNITVKNQDGDWLLAGIE